MGCGKIFKAAVGIGLAFATGGASLLASPLAMASLALSTVGTLSGNKFLSMASMGLSLATGLTKGFGTATGSATETAQAATEGGFIESTKAASNPFTSGQAPSSVDGIASAVKDISGDLTDGSGISNTLAADNSSQGLINDTTAANVMQDNPVRGLLNTTPQVTADTPSLVDKARDVFSAGSPMTGTDGLTSTMGADGAVKSISQWMKENKELVNLGGGLLKGAMSGNDTAKAQALYQKKLQFEMDQINQQNANANTIIGVGRMVNDNAPNLYYKANQARYPNGAPA